MERTVKYPICGQPYKVMSGYTGDQSACPSCVQKAEQNEGVGKHGDGWGK